MSEYEVLAQAVRIAVSLLEGDDPMVGEAKRTLERGLEGELPPPRYVLTEAGIQALRESKGEG